MYRILFLFFLGVITLGKAQDSQYEYVFGGDNLLEVSVFKKEDGGENEFYDYSYDDTVVVKKASYFYLMKKITLPKEAITLSKEEKISLLDGGEINLSKTKEKWGYVTLGEVRLKLTLEGLKEEKISYLYAYLFLFLFLLFYTKKVYSKVDSFEEYLKSFNEVFVIFMGVLFLCALTAFNTNTVAISFVPVLLLIAVTIIIFNRSKGNKTIFAVGALVGQGLVSFIFETHEFFVFALLAISLGWFLGWWKKRKIEVASSVETEEAPVIE